MDCRFPLMVVATAERIAPGEGLAAAEALLNSDPARAVEGVEPFRQWMQDLQDRTIAEMDGVHFDIPEPVKRIEALISPPGGALAMYYTPPSEDFSRPGRAPGLHGGDLNLTRNGPKGCTFRFSIPMP